MRKILLLIVVVSLALSACSGGRGWASYKWKKSDKWTVSKAPRMKAPRSDVKLVTNERVNAWVGYFTGAGREQFNRYLTRSGRYTALMQRILAEQGLPEDLIHVALIESGFSSGAYSRAHAVGFWQFISSTGRHYGLRIDPYVDERMDPIKSTYAAAQYLTDLYNEFGDWYLALAGYNAGEGKVRKAVSRYGTRDFWKLTSRRTNHFRPETKDYVPKFIAAAMIARNPKKYGFRPDYHKPLEFEFTTAGSQTDYETIAKCTRSDVETISILNPELAMGVTPPD